MAGEDRRIIKTRKAIADAFWQLLRDRNFRDISVHDVSTVAQISRTTFYHHYSDKFDWLEQTIRERLAPYVSGYQTSDLRDRATAIALLTKVFRGISADSRLCRLLLANENPHLLYTYFRDTMLEQHRQNTGLTTLTPEEDLTVHYLASTTSAYIEWWVRNDTIFTPEQLANCIYSFHHADDEKKT